MSKIIEALIEHLAYIKEQKDKLPAALFPDSFSEREEFRKLLEDYMKGVDHHIQEIQRQNLPNIPLVIIHSKVEVEEVNSGEIRTFKIVGPFEGKPEKDCLSYLAPAGKALLLGKPGDIVKVDAPRGSFQYRINYISLPEA